MCRCVPVPDRLKIGTPSVFVAGDKDKRHRNLSRASRSSFLCTVKAPATPSLDRIHGRQRPALEHTRLGSAGCVIDARLPPTERVSALGVPYLNVLTWTLLLYYCSRERPLEGGEAAIDRMWGATDPLARRSQLKPVTLHGKKRAEGAAKMPRASFHHGFDRKRPTAKASERVKSPPSVKMIAHS